MNSTNTSQFNVVFLVDGLPKNCKMVLRFSDIC